MTAVLEGHAGRVRAVAFAPGGHVLASGGEDGTLRLWDAASGRSAGTLGAHTNALRGVAFSPDGRWPAAAIRDGTVQLWDVGRSELLSQLKLGPELAGLVWGPDGITAAARTGVVQLDVRLERRLHAADAAEQRPYEHDYDWPEEGQPERG